MRVLVILFLTFALLGAAPVPNPQEKEEPAEPEEPAPQPPAPGSKPPGFLASLPKEDENPGESELGAPSNEPAPAPAAGEASPLPGAELPERSKSEEKSNGNEPECGPTCMLVNQTPIILLICILVLVILLLIILFGCYFIKKLHGKAIFTTAQRHRNLLGNERDVAYLKGGEYVEKKTFETVSPGKSETKSVVTTTTTKVVQSEAKDGSFESPVRSTDRII